MDYTFSFTSNTDNKVFYALLSRANEEINTKIKRPFKQLVEPSEFVQKLEDIVAYNEYIETKYINHILELCEELEIPYLRNNERYCLELYMKDLSDKKDLNSIHSINLNLNKADVLFSHCFSFHDSYSPQFVERIYDDISEDIFDYAYEITSAKILNHLKMINFKKRAMQET